jgi:hypothetical protein
MEQAADVFPVFDHLQSWGGSVRSGSMSRDSAEACGTRRCRAVVRLWDVLTHSLEQRSLPLSGPEHLCCTVGVRSSRPPSSSTRRILPGRARFEGPKWSQSPLPSGLLRQGKGKRRRGTGPRDYERPGRCCHLSSPRRGTKQEVLERAFKQEVERHLYEMGESKKCGFENMNGEAVHWRSTRGAQLGSRQANISALPDGAVPTGAYKRPANV